MKKKTTLVLIISFIILILFYLPKFLCKSQTIVDDYCLYNMNLSITGPVLSILFPFLVLSILFVFLKNILLHNYLKTVIPSFIILLIITYQINSECQGWLCPSRSQVAFLLSCIFSIAYFIFLLIKNRK